MDEHGLLLGLHKVDAEAAHQYEFWEGVDMIIKAYTRINPGEMAAILADNKLQRDQNASATGSNQSKTQRSTISLPFGLMLVLEEYEPEIFTNKKMLYEFMRLFPGLRTCHKI